MYISPAAASPYSQAVAESIEEVAEAENAEVTIVDSQVDPQKQRAALQDAVQSQRYDAIILQPIDPVSAVPAVAEAKAAGLKVGITSQPLGPDTTTADPQVDGVQVSVLTPPSTWGATLGEAATQACGSIDPCKIGYLFGIKAVPTDIVGRKAFDEVIAKSSSIEVAAEGESQYSATGGLKATQNMLQANPDIDVLVANADQGAAGAERAIKAAGLQGEIKIVGLGAGKTGVSGVRDGRWFATVITEPRTEGRLAMEGVLAAVREGKVTGGIDPLDKHDNHGILTKDNVESFRPQWDG
ncbi:MAG: sugar ABC transporter substrate-binding protein [Thermoleophilaceae bacterium]